jgi:glycine cleavage system H protein
MTPDAENSKWVEREILLADRENKPIIPLLLDGREFGMLINVQFYDVRDGGLPAEDAFDKLASFLPQEESQGKTAVLDPTVIAQALAQTTGQDHLWVRELANDVATIGITDVGLQNLGAIMRIEFPSLDANLRHGALLVAIETEKALVELFSPITGTVTRVNPDLKTQPMLVNTDPFSKGWLVQTRDTVLPKLMNAVEYEIYCETL